MHVVPVHPHQETSITKPESYWLFIQIFLISSVAHTHSSECHPPLGEQGCFHYHTGQSLSGCSLWVCVWVKCNSNLSLVLPVASPDLRVSAVKADICALNFPPNWTVSSVQICTISWFWLSHQTTEIKHLKSLGVSLTPPPKKKKIKHMLSNHNVIIYDYKVALAPVLNLCHTHTHTHVCNSGTFPVSHCRVCVCICVCVCVFWMMWSFHWELNVQQWRVYKAETDKQPSFVWPWTFAAHRNAARQTHTFTVMFTHIPGTIAPLSPFKWTTFWFRMLPLCSRLHIETDEAGLFHRTNNSKKVIHSFS